MVVLGDALVSQTMKCLKKGKRRLPRKVSLPGTNYSNNKASQMLSRGLGAKQQLKGAAKMVPYSKGPILEQTMRVLNCICRMGLKRTSNFSASNLLTRRKLHAAMHLKPYCQFYG